MILLFVQIEDFHEVFVIGFLHLNVVAAVVLLAYHGSRRRHCHNFDGLLGRLLR